MPLCWVKVSNRKVLRPAISAQVLLGFPASISKCWDGSLYSKLLPHASHAAHHQDQISTPRFMFFMCYMYVKLPPDDSPIAVNKFTYLLTIYILQWHFSLEQHTQDALVCFLCITFTWRRHNLTSLGYCLFLILLFCCYVFVFVNFTGYITDIRTVNPARK
jgi:hypothetical protein